MLNCYSDIKCTDLIAECIIRKHDIQYIVIWWKEIIDIIELYNWHGNEMFLWKAKWLHSFLFNINQFNINQFNINFDGNV